MSLRAIHLTYAALFVCLMTIGANVTVWFPFLAIPIGGATVPLSLQSFFAILAGLLLGKKIGSISMLVYLLLGLTGLPIFAGLKGGFFALINPTGGFILSFIFTAWVTGLLVEKLSKPSLPQYLSIAVTGIAVNYGIGVTYMYMAMNSWLQLDITYAVAWAGMIPFLMKDLFLSLIAGMFMVALQKRIPSLLKRVKSL